MATEKELNDYTKAIELLKKTPIYLYSRITAPLLAKEIEEFLKYIDYLEKSPGNLRKVKRSPLTSTNLLAKAINSQKPL